MSVIGEKIKQVNEFIAVKATLIFGSMWLTYIFFIYGFAPLIWPKAQDSLLYWSNTIQLWSLPLLMVGTNILGRASEKRSQDMYEMIKIDLANSTAEIATLKEIRDAEIQELQELKELITTLTQQK